MGRTDLEDVRSECVSHRWHQQPQGKSTCHRRIQLFLSAATLKANTQTWIATHPPAHTAQHTHARTWLTVRPQICPPLGNISTHELRNVKSSEVVCAKVLLPSLHLKCRNTVRRPLGTGSVNNSRIQMRSCEPKYDLSSNQNLTTQHQQQNSFRKYCSHGFLLPPKMERSLSRDFQQLMASCKKIRATGCQCSVTNSSPQSQFPLLFPLST